MMFIFAMHTVHKTSAQLSLSGTVTQDSPYTAGYNCPENLVDGIFYYDTLPDRCCSITGTELTTLLEAWYNIEFANYPAVVETVIIINRETSDGDVAETRIYGSDLYVGFDPLPKNNFACGATPQGSGEFSCGGKMGRYLGLYELSTSCCNTSLNISQIRAYSYK